MADAIHAVLKEGLSLSQAARKYDIPYPTFVLYANRVHNLLGPSHEPGDMRPKGRGRPQRILLGSWPEEQIKGVIRAVVFRDTAVFRDGDHKENKKPATPQIKDESSAVGHSSNGPFTPNSSLTPNGTSDKSGNSTPIPPSTPGTSQPLPPGVLIPPLASPPIPGFNPISLPSPIGKLDGNSGSANGEMSDPKQPVVSSSSNSGSTPVQTNTASNTQAPSTPVSSAIPLGPATPQSRPSSASSTGPLNGPLPHNGFLPPLSNALSHSPVNNNNLANSLINSLASKINGSVNPGALSPIFTNGGIPLPPVNPLSHSHIQQPPLSNPQQQTKPTQHSPSSQQKPQQLNPGHPHHMNHQQSLLHNPHMSQQQRNVFSQANHQLSNQQQNPRHQQMAGPQQMLGLLAGGLSPSGLPTPPVPMARLFGEGPHFPPRPPQPPMNAFHPGYPRPGPPGLPGMGIHGPLNSLGPRMSSEDADPSPEALLFGKITSTDRHSFSQSVPDIGGRPISSTPFDGTVDSTQNSIDRPLMFRDALDTIKSEPEAIMN